MTDLHILHSSMCSIYRDLSLMYVLQCYASKTIFLTYVKLSQFAKYYQKLLKLQICDTSRNFFTPIQLFLSKLPHRYLSSSPPFGFLYLAITCYSTRDVMSLLQCLTILHLYTNSINPIYISPPHQFLRISAPTYIQSQNHPTTQINEHAPLEDYRSKICYFEPVRIYPYVVDLQANLFSAYPETPFTPFTSLPTSNCAMTNRPSSNHTDHVIGLVDP